MPQITDPCTDKASINERINRLDYMAELLSEIRKMALSLEEEALAYLVEVAMMEAKLQSGLTKKFPKAQKNMQHVIE